MATAHGRPSGPCALSEPPPPLLFYPQVARSPGAEALHCGSRSAQHCRRPAWPTIRTGNFLNAGVRRRQCRWRVTATERCRPWYVAACRRSAGRRSRDRCPGPTEKPLSWFTRSLGALPASTERHNSYLVNVSRVSHLCFGLPDSWIRASNSKHADLRHLHLGGPSTVNC